MLVTSCSLAHTSDTALAQAVVLAAAKVSCQVDEHDSERCKRHGRSGDIVQVLGWGCDVLFQVQVAKPEFNPLLRVRGGNTLLHSLTPRCGSTITECLVKRIQAACTTENAWYNFIDSQNASGITAVFQAIGTLSLSGSGSYANLEILLKNGANANIPSENGMHPLYEAIAYGHDEAVHILMRYGANPDSMCPPGRQYDGAGMTIRQWAAGRQQPWEFKEKIAIKK